MTPITIARAVTLASGSFHGIRNLENSSIEVTPSLPPSLAENPSFGTANNTLATGAPEIQHWVKPMRPYVQ